MAQTISLTITGEEIIHCSSCEQRIERALRRLPGVQTAEASARTQQVSVTFEPTQVAPDQMQARLAQIGFQAAVQGGGQ